MIFKKKLNRFKYYNATPTPSKNYLNNFYTNIYFKKETTATYSKKYSKKELINKIERANFIIEFLLNKVKKKKFLDLGSGEGFLLRAAYNKNFKVLGVDYDDYAIKNFNKEIIKFFIKSNPDDFIQNSILKKEKFNIVALQNVLEHVPNPSSLILNIRKILFKKSYLLVQVPNDFKDLHFLLKIKKYINKYWFFNPPQHLNYFNFNNIQYFFKMHGFKLIDAISDFPIELFLAFKDNYVNKPKLMSKASHNARLLFDNYILSQGFKKSYNFFKSCNDVGIGRSMILIFRMI
jgi:2-polyprenyl-3-methyl-5-hydroxy-6-metoxy-1,4-benzoquinol methylase